jgi:hypothetical protein
MDAVLGSFIYTWKNFHNYHCHKFSGKNPTQEEWSIHTQAKSKEREKSTPQPRKSEKRCSMENLCVVVKRQTHGRDTDTHTRRYILSSGRRIRGPPRNGKTKIRKKRE